MTECSFEELANVHKEMDAFKETGKSLQEDCKEKAAQCPRAFCVMVLSADLSPATMKWSQKYENYRVIVGK